MENANMALIIAGSTIIAVMLFGMFSLFISNVSIWPQAQDDMENAEQVAAFNAEYEVYQKSAMYGVDVISCLNKAKSNNEKYVAGGSFVGENAYGKNYEINVTVEIKTPLTESIQVTAMEPVTGAVPYREKVIYSTDNVKTKSGNFIKLNEVFNISTDQLTKLNPNDYLKYNMSSTDNSFHINTVYNLVDPSVSDENNVLKKILKHSNDPKQIKKNSEFTENYVYNSDIGKYGWTTATWSTYLYDFKQKKFKCTNLEYSNRTGRICKI